MPVDAKGGQWWQQTDRPATKTDSTPLDSGASLDTFFRRDANGQHFESSYPVETTDNTEFNDAWSGAAGFRSPGRSSIEDVGPLSCIATRKKSERRRSQEASNATKYADARKPGPHAPYSAPSADEGPRPAPIIGVDGGVLPSDTTVQPDGTVVRGDGEPIGKVQPDGTVVGPDGAVLGKMSTPNDGGAVPRRFSPPPSNASVGGAIEKALEGVGNAIGGAVNGTVEGTKGLVKDPVGTIKGGPKKIGGAIMGTVDGTKAAAKKVHEMSSKALDKTLTALHLPPLSGSQLALVQPDGTVLGPDGKVIGRMGADGNIEYFSTGFMAGGLPSVPTPLHSSVLGPGCIVHPDGAIIGPDGRIVGKMNADGTSWSGGDPGARREAAPIGESGRRRRRVQPRTPEGWTAPATDRIPNPKNALPMPPPPQGTPPPLGGTLAEAAQQVVADHDAETAAAALRQRELRKEDDIYAAAAASLPAGGGYYEEEEEAPPVLKPIALSPTKPATALPVAPRGLPGDTPENEDYEYYEGDLEDEAEGGGYAGDGAAPLQVPNAPPEGLAPNLPGASAAAPPVEVEEDQYEYYEEGGEEGGDGGDGGDAGDGGGDGGKGGVVEEPRLPTQPSGHPASAASAGGAPTLATALGDGGQGVGAEPPTWMGPAAAVAPPKVDPDAAAPPGGDEYDYYEEGGEEAAAAPAAVEPAELAAQLQHLVSPVAQQQPSAGPGPGAAAAAAAAAAEEENEYYDDEEEEEEEVGGAQAAAPPAAAPPPTAQPEEENEYYDDDEEEEEAAAAEAEAQGAAASAADMARAEKEIFADDAAVEKYEYGGGPSEVPQKPSKKSVMKLGGLFGGKKPIK
jgi:hypothetical protein